MLRALGIVSREAFTLLLRDKVFVPAVLAGLGVAAMANVASDWSIEEFSKILFDVGYFGFHTAGCLVAIFWGTKAVTDSRQEGALEVQLAAPVGRSTWLVGKYLGIAAALVVLGGILLAIWQGLMLLNQFGWMTRGGLIAFGFMVLSWLVTAALATLFASFCRQPVAVFASLSLWLSGLATALVARALAPDTPPLTRQAVEGLARVWDLQQLNLLQAVHQPGLLGRAELGYRAAYGSVLIFLLISLACVIFSRRDATA